MSDKFVYQNARVKSMEASLFTAQSVGRLLDCTSVDAAYKTLTDMGFGGGASADEGLDGLFKAEEARAVDFLKEFNVDGALDVFLAEYDFLNVKLLFKGILSGKPTVTAPSGLFEVDDIKSWLEQDGASDVPKALADTVAELKKLTLADGVSPRRIDCIVDRAQFAYVFSSLKKNSMLRAYFVKKADAMNVSAFVRCKRLGLAKTQFAEGFIEGGKLDFLPEIYDASLDVLKEKCKRTDYDELVTKLVDDGDLVAFEVAVDNALLKMFKDEKNDLFSIAPIVAFYLTRITQIRVAKLAVAGIRNGVDQSKIRERMRELYA